MSDSRRLMRRRAFTLVEVVLSMVIVSVMVVAALTTVGAKRWGEYKTVTRSRGLYLAQNLMAEILQNGYEEPVDTVTFGPETGEGTTSRALYDDVDDFHNWSASPPQYRSGTAMNDLADYGRSVSVVWVSPTDLSQTVGSDRGVKRITVTVTHNSVPVSVVHAYRTTVWTGIPEVAPGGSGDPNDPPAANHSPTALVQASRDWGYAPLSIDFTGDASSDPDGDPLTYAWDFGDGGNASGVNVSHTFGVGTFTVTLTVSDGLGGVDTDSIVIRSYYDD